MVFWKFGALCLVALFIFFEFMVGRFHPPS